MKQKKVNCHRNSKGRKTFKAAFAILYICSCAMHLSACTQPTQQTLVSSSLQNSCDRDELRNFLELRTLKEISPETNKELVRFISRYKNCQQIIDVKLKSAFSKNEGGIYYKFVFDTNSSGKATGCVTYELRMANPKNRKKYCFHNGVVLS